MKWNTQQTNALKEIEHWFKFDTKHKRIFRLFGYAGTGKTTLAKYIAEMLGVEVRFAAYTGKAALMLIKKGCHGASTIHSLIYKCTEDENGIVSFLLNSKLIGDQSVKLIIIDECSMVDEEMGKDLLSFNIPILVLGDPAQLPPIEGAGFFTVQTPDVLLTEIHRQAKDNPIIYLATLVREGNKLKIGKYGDSEVLSSLNFEHCLSVDQVIVGRNATRNKINNRFRKTFGYENIFPHINEKMICLKNNRRRNVFNGGIYKVLDTPSTRKKDFIHLVVNSEDFEDKPRLVPIHKKFFDESYPLPDWRILRDSTEFDYGYAITCHKSQGSQWNTTLINDESWCFRDMAKRWLYTAITRSAENTKIVIT